jgi:hypothetical protein
MDESGQFHALGALPPVLTGLEAWSSPAGLDAGEGARLLPVPEI